MWPATVLWESLVNGAAVTWLQATSKKLEEVQAQLLDSSQRLELALAEQLTAQQTAAELHGTLEATLAKVRVNQDKQTYIYFRSIQKIVLSPSIV